MPCRARKGTQLRSPPLSPPPTGERLEDKLDAILELFQRQLVSPPPPPPPVLLRRNGAGELPTSFTDVGVEVAGVRLSWQDAHAFCAVEQFAAVAKTLCGFPSFFAAPLLRRIRHQYGAEKVAVGYGVDSVALSPEWRTLTPAEEAAQVAALTGGGSAARGPSAGEESKHSGSDFVVRRSIALSFGPERTPVPEDLADRDVSTHVSLPAFLAYWRAEMEPYDACDRFLRLVSKRSGAAARGVGRVMESADFMPFMEELLVWAGEVGGKEVPLAVPIPPLSPPPSGLPPGPRLPRVHPRVPRKVRAHRHRAHLLRPRPDGAALHRRAAAAALEPPRRLPHRGH